MSSLTFIVFALIVRETVRNTVWHLLSLSLLAFLCLLLKRSLVDQVVILSFCLSEILILTRSINLYRTVKPSHPSCNHQGHPQRPQYIILTPHTHKLTSYRKLFLGSSLLISKSINNQFNANDDGILQSPSPPPSPSDPLLVLEEVYPLSSHSSLDPALSLLNLLRSDLPHRLSQHPLLLLDDQVRTTIEALQTTRINRSFRFQPCLQNRKEALLITPTDSSDEHEACSPVSD
ncbi:hypothetical protein GMRT_12323 [Giardia muris]|uniref:Uncharacterized protein n=1 Tax=Giardia muris TaxID=5742 RepID=A0A4Z1T340_GIAMU|nr:hypothetical protein GMRT_12323 [Giardia muris]|eukprot:TNJ28363.1 hypothetical protein GMRT_12323 [Giardia muris]